MTRLLLLCFSLLILASCVTVPMSSSPTKNSADKMGVLVMAHGGGDVWNAGVIEVVEPLRNEHNIEIAFGMADAYSLQEAVTKLEANGAEKISVVRLFISGESFYERTEQILGLAKGAPARDMNTMSSEMEMPGGMRMEFWRLDTEASFTLSQEGLSDAKEMAQVLLERASALSTNPANEDVLILAHGPGDDAENQRWLDNINARTSMIQSAFPFRRIQVATLREDWEDKRIVAEQQIRAFVENASAENGTAIVIPYRINGFGPYADVLEGLEYKANEQGLIPHSGVTQWIERQIEELVAADNFGSSAM